ncbi:ABC-F family ATP-binding cassette domain-containing protein [Mucilaginibacter sabulilitoris]|uniref:ABC-F family ATP-binding cassette domain-containing protein n=1 Tax=Mucilaginibacter sabulilitoris TaxID=1173583 RepID=A0ABZ0TGX2_9SPHI|nr:ABC-F family ATP-binding cassette domain-containing protein [Mucilaginibacter sabulilitoris]WPU92445.1 ABC-F family ATP-binding cassette domain-containing protein [Mucilaginibacter sabulilitoris]
MLTLQGVTYIHPNRDVLFSDINLTINKYDKIALIGNNGTGKSTLLKILAGNLLSSSGLVKASSQPYYVPQLFGQFNDYSIAKALQVEDKLNALKEILDGNVTDENMTLLNDDWAIEERCHEAFAHWQLHGLDLTQKMAALSGGQKTKVFLAGINIHRPQIVLLDEPSNHLDTFSRDILYDYITSTTNTLMVASHDRTLLNLLNNVCELGKRGITVYGGNYDFYAEQKKMESDALNQDLKSKEKALRKAKETERESIERQQKLDARGRKKQEKAGLPTIVMNAFKNNAEKSTSRMKGIHAEKVTGISQELTQLRSVLPDVDKMKMDFDNSNLHKGKILVTTKDVNFGYNGQLLWKQSLSFQIISGDRIVIKGANGSGKTTLIRMILGQLHPQSGSIDRAGVKTIYIDQDYSLIDNTLKVYEQAQWFNSGALQEHDIKIRLNRFLFTREYWDKPCKALSGGEKMRLMLCSLAISNQAPDIMVLDEPTNNLDIQNTEILTAAINEYKGTLLVVSHDEHFLKKINVGHSIDIS